MNIEEARKVLWLKSNPRPLGELLDDGYLDKSRLEWAAQYAYNPRLQQAAQLLLDASKGNEKAAEMKSAAAKVPTEIGITLEKARATLWPVPPFKGQLMGDLMDSKQIALKDLGYLAENAWDPRVRQAAIALALVRLGETVKEPVPSAGYLIIVSGGRSYAERSETFWTSMQGIVLGVVISIVVGGLAGLTLRLIRPQSSTSGKPISEIFSSPELLVATLILLLLTVGAIWLFNFLFDRIMNKVEREIENNRAGQEGEEKTQEVVSRTLDGSWHMFRNIRLPGRNKGDLDVVLVGPSGVWVLEIKFFSGQYRNSGEQWEYLRRKKWLRFNKSPSRQAKDNAAQLGGFLKADGINHFVQSAVVWANPESLHSVENPATAIWPLDRLSDELGNIWHEKRIPESEQKKIIEKLTILCERQREAQKRA